MTSSAFIFLLSWAAIGYLSSPIIGSWDSKDKVHAYGCVILMGPIAWVVLIYTIIKYYILKIKRN